MNIIVKDLAETGPEKTGPEKPITDGARMAPHAFKASSLLKALGHEGRLKTLYYLSDGEKTVTELQVLLAAPQALVSSQLARLRHQGMVKFRKEGQTSYYSLADQKTRQMLEFVNTVFCDGLPAPK